MPSAQPLLFETGSGGYLIIVPLDDGKVMFVTPRAKPPKDTPQMHLAMATLVLGEIKEDADVRSLSGFRATSPHACWLGWMRPDDFRLNPVKRLGIKRQHAIDLLVPHAENQRVLEGLGHRLNDNLSLRLIGRDVQRLANMFPERVVP